MSILAIFLFSFSWLILPLLLGQTRSSGVNLSKGAEVVHQKTVTVAARRGTIYDRNGVPIAEDATTYNVYAIIDKELQVATGKDSFIIYGRIPVR